ncbi:extracellular solute-binding protein [Streptomyces sp. NPDC058783]|uniref:extracellular solute-binding protein n=1 Tax=Streptomyces sp. NPDC058783 TaxID=3346633 RepID=UPI00367A069F
MPVVADGRVHHVAGRLHQLADLEVLEPLDDLGIEDAAYQPGPAAGWIGAAGRGDDPGFGKDHVEVYCLATVGGGDGDGQTTWSHFAASAGWTYTDKERWGTEYRYDDDTFRSVIEWHFGLADKGCMAPFTDYSRSNRASAQVAAGRAATAFDGAWMISTYAGVEGMDIATAVTPRGPTGKRATMMNGLVDSVTKNADNKPGALEWVKYLASEECQRTVGHHGIVFPATPGGTEAAVAAYGRKGIDVSAFTRPVDDKKRFRTFTFPITEYTAHAPALIHPAMQDVCGGGKPADSHDEGRGPLHPAGHRRARVRPAGRGPARDPGLRGRPRAVRRRGASRAPRLRQVPGLRPYT